jgi:hypothetical protein
VKKIDEDYVKDSKHSVILEKDVSFNLKEKNNALSNCSKNFYEAEELIEAYER